MRVMPHMCTHPSNAKLEALHYQEAAINGPAKLARPVPLQEVPRPANVQQLPHHINKRRRNSEEALNTGGP